MTFVMLANIQGQMSDAESFLNAISSIDKNKDYDRDGSTETVEHHLELIKINLFVFLPLKPVQISTIALREIPYLPFFDHGLLRLKDFKYKIFRPPMSHA